jgi:uncharacterized protein (TIGR01319 family)
MSETSAGPPAFSSTTDCFCIVDAGSTATKAILFVKQGNTWLFHRKEAPTTVEKPDEDVTIGVVRALWALEEETGRALLSGERPSVPFLCTSSAGGGLAMVVTGLVRHLTAESADRAALGAGAIVLDIVAMNDGRTPYRKIEDLERHRPDMVLLAGGFDGDNISGPVYIAELVVESGLRPKLNPDAKLDIVYAGNVNARDYTRDVFGEDYEFHSVPNIRPAGDREDPEPARRLIHELFMNHVMSNAPGYEKMKPWVAAPIRPTPAAVANLLSIVSRDLQQAILVVDVGGATTDVFSAVDGRVVRTVSANLGLSYSIRNVAETAGIGTISDLAGEDLAATDLWNRIGNKLVHPTLLPKTPADMKMEWAVATAAIREAVINHLEVMDVGEKEPRELRPEIDVLIRGPRRQWEKELQPRGRLDLSLQDYDLVIGSGGILSHSPREAAAMMLIDALEPLGTVGLAVDNAFMFPHLGVLAEVDEALARDLFLKLGFVRLGTLYAPAPKDHEPVPLEIEGVTSSGTRVEVKVKPGEVRAIELAGGETFTFTGGTALAPGPATLEGGACGLIVDNRRRPVSRGAHSLLRGAHTPPPREIQAREEERIQSGPIEIRRELAIPGEVFVSPGQEVGHDTLVARGSKQFLRPFFIEVANHLHISPKETGEYLVKKVGDVIDYGDVIARKPQRAIAFDVVRSNVRATIERILPNGTVVARELPEMAREYVTVRAAEEIGKPGWQLRPYLRVEKGSEVERGQWLAAEVSTHGVRYSASPVRGRVNRINYDFGFVVIEPLLEELDVLAWLPGRVERTSDRGCVVRGEGTRILGIWGLGGETTGPLTAGEVEKGAVVVRPFAGAKDLADLEAGGAAGLVTGGLNLEDMIGAEPGFTIVMTEGFGTRRISPEIETRLRDHEGRLALLDGTTQLRVGVRRPMIILPA